MLQDDKICKLMCKNRGTILQDLQDSWTIADIAHARNLQGQLQGCILPWHE